METNLRFQIVLKNRKGNKWLGWLISSAWGVNHSTLDKYFLMCAGAGSVSASFLSFELGGGGNRGTEGLSKGRREGFGEQMKKKREGGRGLDVTLARHSCQRLKRERDGALVSRSALEWIFPSHTDTHPLAPKLTHVCTHICAEIWWSSFPSSKPSLLTYVCSQR